ncbi:MAG TPA: IPT/TIG domain-containing protein [Streptosporangiaceae bacterium]
MIELTPGAQGLSAPISYLIAAVTLVALFVILWFVCGTKEYEQADGQADPAQPPRRRIWYLFLGADDRVSTSKVQFALWTLALSFALLVIAFHDVVYPPSALDPRYLLLLGFPAGAAVAAKGITLAQISNSVVSKAAAHGKKTPRTAIAEIVSNDYGDLDLGDAQYFLFNLVALVAFFIAFFNDPIQLPVLPATLVGLTSASATAYVAKKMAPPAAVKVTAVSPQKGPVGTQVRVFGSGFRAAAGNTAGPYVTIGGLTAAAQGNPTDTVVTVSVPPGLPTGIADVQLVTADSRTATLPAAFEVT